MLKGKNREEKGSLAKERTCSPFMHLSMFSSRRGGGDTLENSQQKHSCHWEFDRPLKNRGGISDTSVGNSSGKYRATNGILGTKLELRAKELDIFLFYCQISRSNPTTPPLRKNIDRCIMVDPFSEVA